MALVIRPDASELQSIFKDWGRDYFSWDGYNAIINMFEELDCGTDTELDVVAICCDFSEDAPSDICSEYSNIEEIADCMDADGNIEMDDLLDALNYYTYAQLLDNGNIFYQSF